MISKEIKIPKKNQEEINKLFDAVNSHQSAMDHHSEQYRASTNRAWETVKHILPNLKWDEYVFNYDIKKKVVVCLGVIPKK